MMRESVLSIGLLCLTGVAFAAGGGPVDVPTPKPGATPGLQAEARYNAGTALAEKNDWPAAEAAYRDAIRLKADFPEAWNGLGHALKKEKKFDEAILAYNEALRQRPNYAQALEYLGEAYVEMGKLGEARIVLTRLAPIDAHHAEQLARAIAGGTASW